MLQPVLFSKYLGILLGLAFQALLSLCAITLCVSAYQNSSFGAVIIAAVCWGLPVLIRMFFGGNHLAYSRFYADFSCHDGNCK